MAYAYLSYYTAYFKANYPVEFYCACISCETDPEAQSIYVNDAKRRGIDIIAPDINNSEMDFNIHNGKILYGFKGIKGIGDKAIEQIIEHKPYRSALEFITTIVDQNLRIPKQVIEALIKIGAFDNLGVNRRLFLDSYDKIMGEFKAFRKKKENKTADIPLRFTDDGFILKEENVELTLFDILSYEKQYMGIYISGNPFDYARKVIGSNVDSYEDALTLEMSSVFCEIMAVKETKTKAKQQKMGIYKCIDSQNVIFEFPMFPEQYAKYGDSIDVGSFIIVNFKASPRGLICLSVKNVNSLIEEYTKTQKSENSIRSIAIKIFSLMDLKKLLNRKEKEVVEDEGLLRPCTIFYASNNYLFNIGTIQFSSSNESIRLLNQIDSIEVVYNR